MERKGNVAEAEVNDLTTRNEELTQQLQCLQEQLESIEHRRETDTESWRREKDQWLQMLEHGRRIQAQSDQDNKHLAGRVSELQSEYNRNREEREASSLLSGNNLTGSKSQPEPHGTPTSTYMSSSSSADRSGEIYASQIQVDYFRSVLRMIKRHNKAMGERADDLLLSNREIGDFIRQALYSGPVGHEPEILAPGNSGGTTNGSKLRLKTTSSDHQAASGSDRGPNYRDQQDTIGSAPPLRPQPHESKDVDASAFHGRFRPMSDYEQAVSQDSHKVPNSFAAPPSPLEESPDQVESNDDSSSTATQIRNSKSPISVSDKAQLLFGTALTPVSTLPTPNSASSMQRTYFGDGSSQSGHQKGGYEASEAMPPPPPRATALVSDRDVQ